MGVAVIRYALSPRRKWSSWSLRTLLLLFVPLSAYLGYYSHVERQRARANTALDLMFSKGVDLSNGLHHAIIIFKNGNVTDEDLEKIVPAFNGYLAEGAPHIDAMRLMGSPVSAKAVQRFRQSVPKCEVEL